MCMFSGEITDVAETQIFARNTRIGQYLVYSMSYASPDDLAMILPLPTKNAKSHVRFISLEAYPDFFVDMERPFIERARCLTRSIPDSTLKVHTVGSFIASHIPTKHDFTRVSEQFRLHDDVWKALPEAYDSYGFVVFQLRSGRHKVHPMALYLEKDGVDDLYFPTVHVHDGAHVPTHADFDHTLYFQTLNNPKPQKHPAILRTTTLAVESHVYIEKTQGIVRESMPLFRLRLNGMYKNEDLFIR